MIKRSNAYCEIQNLYDDEDKPDQIAINDILDALESAGVEFAPEEPDPSAVASFEKMLSKRHDLGAYYNIDDIAEIGLKMRDEQQTRIADLESQVNIIADENQALENRIEEKYAEIGDLQGELGDALMKIERLKQPLPESPELAKAIKNYYGESNNFLPMRVLNYIDALESELARPRGGS
jgi:septal ring factor EnvC (AmiA/AmiB activator)